MDEIAGEALTLPNEERAALVDRLVASLGGDALGRNDQPAEGELDVAFERGLADVRSGAVRPIEEVRSLLSQWVSKS